jgi:ureidoglycolate lyase
MITLTPQKLTLEAFAPYGRVVTMPAKSERIYFGEWIENLRPQAGLGLSYSVLEGVSLPCPLRLFERHEFSAQAFLPMNGTRYLVTVCPDDGHGRPDPLHAVAFLAGPDQGVIYAAGTWHHPMTSLTPVGQFTVVMWANNDAQDEELIPLAVPMMVGLA